MWKKINKWTLPFLVLAVSVLSILLLYRIVWAQFVPPDSQPGDAITVGLTMNPMAADLDLNNRVFFDGTFTNLSSKKGLVSATTGVLGKAAIYGEASAAGSYAIHGRNTTNTTGAVAGFFEGDLCLGTVNPGDCIDSWNDISAGGGGDTLWRSGDAGKIIYATSTTGNAELDLQTGAHNYWALYHDNVSEDLRFWNNDVPGDKNALTLEISGEVGIGTVDPAARLEVRSTGSGNILDLYDGSTNVLSVADGGNTTLTNGNFTASNGNVLLTNGSLGLGAVDPLYKLNIVAPPSTTGLRSAGGAVGLYGEGSFAGIFGVAPAAGFYAGYFQGPVYVSAGNNSISVNSTSINLGTGGEPINFSSANVNFAGNVRQNGGYYIMRNAAFAPTATDCDATTEQGRIYLNYANDRLYVCSGAPVPAWKFTTLTP